jgi:hypothetical protein
VLALYSRVLSLPSFAEPEGATIRTEPLMIITRVFVRLTIRFWGSSGTPFAIIKQLWGLAPTSCLSRSAASTVVRS